MRKNDEIVVVGSKRPGGLGLIGRYVFKINPEKSKDTIRKSRQQNIHYALWIQRTEEVHQLLGR